MKIGLIIGVVAVVGGILFFIRRRQAELPLVPGDPLNTVLIKEEPRNFTPTGMIVG